LLNNPMTTKPASSNNAPIIVAGRGPRDFTNLPAAGPAINIVSAPGTIISAVSNVFNPNPTGGDVLLNR
jgi:hypothetical protein